MDDNTLLTVRYVCFVAIALAALYFAQGNMGFVAAVLSVIAGVLLPSGHVGAILNGGNQTGGNKNAGNTP